MLKTKNEKNTHYHATRLNLIQSLESHVKSIKESNIYDNVSNKIDSWSMRNEDMNLDVVELLIFTLSRTGDKKSPAEYGEY